MILAPVSRGRAGGGDEGGGRSGGLRHHPSRLLLLLSPCAHRLLCAPAARSRPFDPAGVRLDSLFAYMPLSLLLVLAWTKGEFSHQHSLA